jgi:addiction module HigA family antidote
MLEEVAAERNGGFASLTQKELATELGVSHRALNELLKERRAVTADMAIRLSRVFKTTPDIWMNLQKALDLWDAVTADQDQYAK